METGLSSPHWELKDFLSPLCRYALQDNSQASTLPGMGSNQKTEEKKSGGGIARAFSSRNFRLFWYGHFAFILGVWINRLAVGWITWELTQSATWLGIVGAAAMIPMIFLGPLAGATADRYGHRPQLVTATFIGASFVAVIALLHVTSLLTPISLLLLVACGGVTRSFTVPARSAMVPALVDKKDLSAAIGVNGASYHGGRFIGPAIGGVVLAGWGAGAALFLVAAISICTGFLLMALELEDRGVASKSKKRLLGDLADGFRYTFQHKAIRSVMIMITVATFFLEPYFEMLPAFADLVFGTGETGLAQLMTATGTGAMIGGLRLAQRGRTEGLVRIQLSGLFGGAIGVLVFAKSEMLFLSLGALFVTGFCVVIALIATTSLIQNSVDDAYRARVMSLSSVLVTGGPAVGAIVIGRAADSFGLSAPISVSVALGLIVWILGAPKVWRSKDQLEGSDVISQPEPPAPPSAKPAE